MANVNFNDTLPGSPINSTNVKWLLDANGNISANVSDSAKVTAISADYTVTTEDENVMIVGNINNIFLPANPAPNQIVNIRNYLQACTLNGNGHMLGLGTGVQYTTRTIYPLESIALWFNPATAFWNLFSYVASGWQPWTPTITVQGMTVSAVTIVETTWQLIHPGTVVVRFAAGFTLAGTPFNTIAISPPTILPANGLGLISFAGVGGSPSDGIIPMTPMYVRPDYTIGFYARRLDNANLAAGVWSLQFQGTYRVA